MSTDGPKSPPLCGTVRIPRARGKFRLTIFVTDKGSESSDEDERNRISKNNKQAIGLLPESPTVDNITMIAASYPRNTGRFCLVLLWTVVGQSGSTCIPSSPGACAGQRERQNL